jgi:E3 ubiquitin-protein ligase RGLG
VFNNMFKTFLIFCWAASTHDQEVFSFYPDNRPCNGFEEALGRYREIVPTLRLAGLFSCCRWFFSPLCSSEPSLFFLHKKGPTSWYLCVFNIVTGPTSFAPIIETAIGIVDSTGGQYHVLLIIADGQVGDHVVNFPPLF